MRTYEERRICLFLKRFDEQEIVHENITAFDHMNVMQHLWGRNLIQWQTVPVKRRFFWQPTERKIYALTPFGRKELDDFNREEAEALLQLKVEKADDEPTPVS